MGFKKKSEGGDLNVASRMDIASFQGGNLYVENDEPASGRDGTTSAARHGQEIFRIST